jgi:hypothetical protein
MLALITPGARNPNEEYNTEHINNASSTVICTANLLSAP